MNQLAARDALTSSVKRVNVDERAGFATDHVEGFGDDYVRTLEQWQRRLDERLDDAVTLAGAERARIWRLYLRAARRGFETGFTSIYQVLCHTG